MKLYLIRHGESESNVSGYYRGRHSALSRSGLMQAKKLARRFAKIHIDLIVSSDFERALETADAVRKVNPARELARGIRPRACIEPPLPRGTSNGDLSGTKPRGIL